MLGSLLDEWRMGGVAAAGGGAPQALRGRQQHALATMTAGLSYAIDLTVLGLFWRGGAAPGSLLQIYAGAAGLHLLLFGSLQLAGVGENGPNPNFTGLQMAWAIALQLGAMLWAPALTGYFVGVMFVIFSFGALRLPLRSALGLWMLVSLLFGLLLWKLPLLGAMQPQLRESPWVRAAVGVGISTLLLRCIVLNFRVMALRSRSMQQAAHMAAEAAAARERAIRDGLTGALNRDGLLPLLQHELEQVRRGHIECCVAMIDIDWFKSVNDDRGHLTGDRTLRTLVELLQRHLRAGDRLARFGGEEFILLMPATGEPDAVEVADRLRGLVQGHDWSALAEGLCLTVSIGIAQAHRDDGIDDLLARADTALYGAKASGRNRCCVALQVVG